jgi:hypothetical protein
LGILIIPTGCPSAGTTPGTGDCVPEVCSVVAVDGRGVDVVDERGVDVVGRQDEDGVDVEDEGGVDVEDEGEDLCPFIPASSCWNCWRSACWCEASEIPVPHKR